MRLSVTGSVLILLSLQFAAQESGQRIIRGKVSERNSREPLPYSSVTLKKALAGVITNETGEFELKVPAGAQNDTLIFAAFGYRSSAVAVSSAPDIIAVTLVSNAVQLQEVEVRPQPPEFYVRQAMRRIKNNYPSSPFESLSYYREKIIENGKFIQLNEGIFRSYIPVYTDTNRTQDQLVLFRSPDKVYEVEFMKKERAKWEEKEKREAENEAKKKKKTSSAKSSPSTSTASAGNSTVQPKNAVELSSFGGPDNILKSSRLKNYNFLDTNELDEYRYKFEKSSSINDRSLMVISFDSRGKVEHAREKGLIYLDSETLAIVKVENTGEFVVPLVLRPIIFMFGIGVENPDYSRNMEFRNVGGKWFPQQIKYIVDLKVVKRRMFSKNDRSHFQFDQVYMVNDLHVKDPAPVPAEKRFRPDKPMKEQAKNDLNLTWETVNVMPL